MKPWPVLIAVLLLAAQAQAQTQVVQPPALRGAQDAEKPAEPPPPMVPLTPVNPAPPSAPVLMSPADQARGQCSAICSRDYYFCLAGENPEFCPSEWGQCTATCEIAARRTARTP